MKKKPNLRPDRVYNRMSIAAEKKLEGEVEKAALWPTIRYVISEWMDYVHRYNSLHQKNSFKARRQVELLVKRRGIREVVAFFYSPYCPGDKLFVQFREQLVELHPRP